MANPFGHPEDCACGPACREYQRILLEHEQDERDLDAGLRGLRELKAMKGDKQCYGCKSSIPADGKFCPQCGLSQYKACELCQRDDVPAEGAFCPFCGAAF